MAYVDGYVLALPKKNLKSYKKMASDASKIWMKCGALSYTEAVQEDLESMKKWGMLPFEKTVNLKKNEVIVFAYITYKSRKHRDAVNTKVHAMLDKKYSDPKSQKMPFDMKRMAYGGFQTIVDL